jgi:ABC-type Zn uptake system ZnuABC Zn-binding protein ZnuA
VIATTTIVGDVVNQISEGLVNFDVLLPVGSDPHNLDPTPQDIVKIADADLVFANGAGLETFLVDLIENAGAEERLVYVSEGIDFLTLDGEDQHDHREEVQEQVKDSSHDEQFGVEHEVLNEKKESNETDSIDPHTWTDPNNVVVWVKNITNALVENDDKNREIYETNASKYLEELTALDSWIRVEVERIPKEARRLVTNHASFNYFADEYGFKQVGTLIPGFSTLSEPSARDLAEIEDVILALGVKAVFVGTTVNPSLAQRVAADTGVKLVFVYTGSLSEAGGEADTYLSYMKFNTTAFISALE